LAADPGSVSGLEAKLWTRASWGAGHPKCRGWDQRS